MTTDDYHVDLPTAMKQIERWCYVTEKIDGQSFKVPDPKKVREYMKGLYECMDSDEWVELATAYRDIMFPGKTKGGKRGRPRGPFYGLTGGQRAAKEKEMSQALGVWHIRYPKGCIDCGSKDYAHATGGICNRCRSTLKELGLSMKDYRSMLKEGKV